MFPTKIRTLITYLLNNYSLICSQVFMHSLLCKSLHTHTKRTSKQTVGFPGVSDGKESCLQDRRPMFDPWVRKIPWRREWQLNQYSSLENSMDRGV